MAKLKGQLFARLALDYFDHPKIAALSDAAIVAHLQMVVYARKYGTNGAIPMAIANAVRIASARRAVIERSRQPVHRRATTTAAVAIHGYSDMQETAEQVQARRQARAEAGRKGAESRWQADGKSHGTSHSKSHGKRDGKTMAETETETETETDTDSSIGRTAPQRPAPKRASQLPDSWTPSDAHRQQAAERGIDVNLEADKMRDWAISKGEARKDWDATFRNWLRNARPQQVPRGARSTTSQRLDSAMALQQKLLAQEGHGQWTDQRLIES
jgi:hypothetical protein